MVSEDALPLDTIAIVGGGPAGLFAAEVIARAGHRVTIYERTPSVARKFLLAGRGGLNLTHSEPLDAFLSRYGDRADDIQAAIKAFSPRDLQAWANGLGADTFIGTSGRIFPKAMKASPLLRAWLKRLDELGVVIQTRHRWTGFDGRAGLHFETPFGTLVEHPRATLLALGGGSWPRLGSDGSWVPAFAAADISIAPLVAANCGVVIRWSAIFRDRFAGAPLKRIALSIAGVTNKGEAIVTRDGLEGGVVYALGPQIRESLATTGAAQLSLDLKPDISVDELTQRLSRARAGDTMSNVLRKAGNLDAAAVGILRETTLPREPEALAKRIKAVPLAVLGLAPMDRAISTAGGVGWTEVDGHLMLRRRPGTFVAGEMLDWDAPTGGYLLQATFATAAKAAHGMLKWMAKTR